jgi:hypothetical protein
VEGNWDVIGYEVTISVCSYNHLLRKRISLRSTDRVQLGAIDEDVAELEPSWVSTLTF